MHEEILVIENLHNWRIICLQTVVGRERGVCNAMVLSTMFDLDRINQPFRVLQLSCRACVHITALPSGWWDLFLLIQCCAPIFSCEFFLSGGGRKGGDGPHPRPQPSVDWADVPLLSPCFLGFNLDLTIISGEYYTIKNIVRIYS